MTNTQKTKPRAEKAAQKIVRTRRDARASKPKPKAAPPAQPATSRDIRLEIASLFVLALALILFLSLITYRGGQSAGGQEGNWIGSAGSWIASFALQGFGYSAYLVTFAIAAIGLVLGMRRSISMKIKEISGFILGALACSVLLALLIPTKGLLYNPGGVLGDLTGRLLIPVLGEVGLGIVSGLTLVLAIVMATNQPPVQAAVQIGRGLWKGLTLCGRAGWWLMRRIGAATKQAVASVHSWWSLRREARAQQRLILQAEPEPEPQPKETKRRLHLVTVDDEEPEPEEAAVEDEPVAPIIAGLEQTDLLEAIAQAEQAEAAEVEDEAAHRSILDRGEKQVVIARRRKVVEESPEPDATERTDQVAFMESEPNDDTPDTVNAELVASDFADEDLDPDSPPEIVDRRPKRATKDEIDGTVLSVEDKETLAEYELPSISLLDYNPESSSDIDRETLFANARLLEQTLLDYKIEGRVKEIHPGPVITMYEFAPARGTKLSRIANLEDDLAMALAALKVRIVAPIPGKSVVGIEVPSKDRETVYLKEIVGHRSFSDSKSKLSMALGKDIFGYPVTVDLQKMPHLLIAGATGAGKSVGVNTMILSILFRCTPDEVRFILIDPKRLEFNFYEGIPHLLLPVVTDPKQAALALGWVVHEMDTRYQLLSEWGVKNIDSYNKLVRTFQESSQRRGGDIQQMADEFALNEGGDAASIVKMLKANPMPTRMPFIVVVIDELADLMMVAGKEVELSIARLAQLARASGIHLIVATQRPSTDVLTGLIKNNFPARISFRVAQKVDSRVILDQNGAEALLGRGDMLYIPGGESTRRVHGAYVSEKETRRVVSFIKKQRTPTYQSDILERIEAQAEEEKAAAEIDGNDSEYDKAVAIICDSGKASISMLQRKLRIGYNRAARIIEQMEEEGIVGPSDGVKGRPVYGRPMPR